MKRTTIVLLLFAMSWAGSMGKLHAQQANYIYKKGDRYGTGKWYMGREIATVMGFQGISWLERPEREQEEQTKLLIKNMDIQPTDVIADVGAGSGYHVFRMAKKAKKGRIYAVDIQEEMLAEIAKKRSRKQADLIQTIFGNEQGINLDANTADKILMVDVYHEFSYPVEMLASIYKALKPGGRIYLVEYRAEDPMVPIKAIHKMTEAQAVKEFRAAGLKFVKNIDNLPWQHCLIFRKE